MKGKWYAEFEGVCTNGEYPYRGDTCPTSEHPEVCKYSETKYEASELVKILRCCGSYEYLCDRCPARGSAITCESKEALVQAADMLEKLGAENESLKMLLPDGLKEDDSDGKKP